ncbi:MAG: LLM class flavin-dependent oxidoreductase [Candidatus Odinarchaeota archaeon]|nr:LLM class flavin-dependent oxidoreductase [Candidatus Thorarchaeota archaeon]
MYRASVGITTSMELSATNWIGRNADSLGVEGIWVGEDIGLGQETSILTASLLENTTNARVGTGIIPISVHNLSTIARTALTLQELGRGRFVLGIGLGGIQDLQRLGKQVERPVSALRDATLSLKRLFNSESVTVESELFTLTDYSLRISQSIEIPIFFGVRGPQMLKLAGKIADGVILSGPQEYLRYAIDTIDKVASKREIEKVVWLPTIPTFKGGSEKLAKQVVALVVADTPEQVLDLLDIDREQAIKIREVVAASGPKAGAEFINQQFIDTFAISGTKEHMVDRFEEVHRLGATEVVLGPPFSGEWRQAMTEIFEEIHRRRDV